MDSVQINSELKLSFQEILNGLSKSEVPDLERFMEKLSTIVAQRKSSHLSEKETDLLKKINKGAGQEFMKKYLDLSTKVQNETITESEHKELLEMIPVVENHRIERLQSLIELAGLWEMSLDDTMKKLGITPPPPMHA